MYRIGTRNELHFAPPCLRVRFLKNVPSRLTELLFSLILQVMQKTLRFAFYKTLPIMISYFFVATAFGLLMRQAGWGFSWALEMSVFLYTGALQFVLVSFLSGGAPILTVFITALFLSSRQVFYGISFLNSFRKAGRTKPYLIHIMTDETYALFSSIRDYPEGVEPVRAQLMMGTLAHLSWILGTMAGCFAGDFIPSSIKGIDFALTSLFVTIVLDQWKSADNLLPAMIGASLSLLFLCILGPERFLLPSLLASCFLLLIYGKRTPPKSPAQKEVPHE